MWSQSSIRHIANQQHLFTRSIAGEDSDDFERWMDQQVEFPAQRALSKVRSGESLESSEWERLLRFIALHDIRNPANYLDSMKRWQVEMPEILKKTLQLSVIKMEEDRGKRNQSFFKVHYASDLIPMKVSKNFNNNSDYGQLKAEVLLGVMVVFNSACPFEYLQNIKRAYLEHYSSPKRRGMGNK
jgi:hypothetical protein